MPSRTVALAVAALFLALLLPTTGAQDTQPSHCTPVSLSSYAVYSQQNVRAVWDSYMLDSRGVCEWRKESGPNTMPACRYSVQLAVSPFGWYGNLCWWGTPAPGLSTTLGPRDVQEVVNDILGKPEVQARLGQGQVVIMLEIGDDIVTVVARNGLVATIDGKLAPPPKCYTTYLGGYREYADPNVKRVWDAYSADSIGVCRWDVPDRPTGDCNHMVEFGGATAGIPPFWLCWWGKLVSVAQAGVEIPPDMTITMSRDAWLAVANSGSPADTLLWMYKLGNVAVKMRAPEKQVALKAAKAYVLGDGNLVDLDALKDSNARHYGIDPTMALFNDVGTPFAMRGPFDASPEEQDLRRRLSEGAGAIFGTPRNVDPWLYPTREMIGLDAPPINDATLVDPLPEPGTGAGWDAPDPDAPSVIDEVDADPPEEGPDDGSSVIHEITLDDIFQHGLDAARSAQQRGIDAWSRTPEASP